MATKRQPKLRILCFGDSLTSGYSRYGAVYHPYNERLEEKLQAAFPDVRIEITTDGRPGDVTGNFMMRILSYFERDHGPKPYDWTIVLGGTNDIAHQITSDSIFENLSKTWNVAMLKRSKVLALTVPEAGIHGAIRARYDARRNKLNDMIKAFKRPNYYTFDLNKEVPFHAMSKEDQEKYWDDNVHLTGDGYDLMGEKIADHLIAILDKEGIPGRKRFRDDDTVFQEEDGDPSCLDQGYIVVRRKDLD